VNDLQIDIMRSLLRRKGLGLEEIADKVGVHPETAKREMSLLAGDLAVDVDFSRQTPERKYRYQITVRGQELLGDALYLRTMKKAQRAPTTGTRGEHE
tara:strand:- start:6017 stop:6310 length:294 start_codon:yes stop_codon:yes gene_type:complete